MINDLTKIIESPMADTTSYAVYSDLEEGFLIEKSPSMWHYDPSYAIRFSTEKEARAAAGRRQFAFAKPVRLLEVDGTIDYEPLAENAKAEGGAWIVLVKNASSPERLHYLMSIGKRLKLSTSSTDAKGYKLERFARNAADLIGLMPGLTAEAKQITAKILAFPSIPK
jgi:hypothetical protein